VKIQFYKSASDRSYFEDFIDRLHKQDKARVLAVFEDIRKYGLDAIGCEFRQIDGKLWEIKIKTATGGYRFFYVMLSKELMMVLHSYKKQGQKAPLRELEIARKRLKEVLI
jgi:phage-related protein